MGLSCWTGIARGESGGGGPALTGGGMSVGTGVPESLWVIFGESLIVGPVLGAISLSGASISRPKSVGAFSHAVGSANSSTGSIARSPSKNSSPPLSAEFESTGILKSASNNGSRSPDIDTSMCNCYR